MKNEKVREQAFRDYQEGMKYKEIAEKYGVSLSTVKSWASRYWKKGCNLEEKKLQPKKEKVATKEKSKRAVAEDVDYVLENTDLTDKQRLFCLYYMSGALMQQKHTRKHMAAVMMLQIQRGTASL